MLVYCIHSQSIMLRISSDFYWISAPSLSYRPRDKVCANHHAHTPTILLCTGGKQQVKLLESALSSLLQCEPALRHYQTEEEVSGGGEAQQQPDVSEGERDAFLVLLLTRLLGVLKQLVAAAMKKRFIPPQRQYPSLLG